MKYVNTITQVLFITCLILLSFAIQFYRKTIIDVEILLVLMCTLSAITTIVSHNFLVNSDVVLKKGEGGVGVKSFLIAYLYNWVIVGGFAVFILLFANIHFSDKLSINTHQVYIEKIDKLPPGRYVKNWTYYIEVVFENGIHKEVFLDKSEISTLSVGQNYELDLHKGFFGFDIIEY